MIGMNLKYLRKQAGLSQEDVAEKMNVSRQSVAKWENDETLPDIINCTKLANIYGITLDELVNISLENGNVQNENTSDGKYVFGMVKVGDRGQIVIPKSAREIYKINSGDKLIVVGDQRGIAIAKIKEHKIFGLE